MFFGRLRITKENNPEEKPIPKVKILVNIFLLVAFLLNNIYAHKFPDNNKLAESIIKINDYLTSPEFYKLRLLNGELASVDSLFKKALFFSGSDTSEALLALTFALLPFNKMKLKLSFSNSEIDLLLPTLQQRVFVNRKESLPRNFLPDSPRNSYADTDKLSHFFGNAFISYNLNFFNLSEFLGIFVESFEKLFKVGGAFDLRDLQTNRLGSAFGKALRRKETVYPSTIIKFYSLTFFRIP